MSMISMILLTFVIIICALCSSILAAAAISYSIYNTWQMLRVFGKKMVQDQLNAIKE